jgi:GMP synthase-like glutamine amidotransferase
MRAHYLQHVPFEELGSIEDWLRQAGYEITATRLYQSEKLPDIADLDFLVVMGGPMSVNDVDEYPWLDVEKKFIKKAIAAGVPTLGVCLGAQLIANSLGGEVYPNPVKEIGWFPIQAVKPEGDTVFSFPEESEVFHWHGETFDLPPGAVRLAESRGCGNQAFQLGSSVIGLQFHLETTPDSAVAIVENCRDELVAGEYIQTEADILSASSDRYEAINRLMVNVLEYLQKGRREAW